MSNDPDLLDETCPDCHGSGTERDQFMPDLFIECDTCCGEGLVLR